MQRRGFLAGAGAALLAACSPVRLLNAVTPEAAAGVERGIAYGENPRQRLDLYRPTRNGGPADVVIFFYGGNWKSGSRGDYAFVGQALAGEGLLAVVPDYRLYPEVRFPRFVEDAAAAVRTVQRTVAARGGNPGRIFLMGHSAGGQIAAMLALNPRYLDAAGVPRGTVRGLIGLAGAYDFLPLRPDLADVFGGTPDLAEILPVSFADGTDPPALLLVGEADRTVGRHNADNLASRLNQAGGQARVVSYPNLGHVEIVAALSTRLARFHPPVLEEVVRFIRSVR